MHVGDERYGRRCLTNAAKTVLHRILAKRSDA